MSYTLSNPYIKYPLLAIYALAQGYFLGLMLIWILPGISGISWPYSLIPGYTLGGIMSALVTFVIFKKWQATPTKKIVVAIVILILIVALSANVSLWMMQATKMRTVEVLGD